MAVNNLTAFLSGALLVCVSEIVERFSLPQVIMGPIFFLLMLFGVVGIRAIKDVTCIQLQGIANSTPFMRHLFQILFAAWLRMLVCFAGASSVTIVIWMMR